MKVPRQRFVFRFERSKKRCQSTNISVKTVGENLRFAVIFMSKRKSRSAPDVGPAIRKECFLSLVVVPQLVHAHRRHQDSSSAEVNRNEAVCLTDDRTKSKQEYPVEIVYSRMKNHGRLNDITVRKRRKVAVHSLFPIIVAQAVALAFPNTPRNCVFLSISQQAKFAYTHAIDYNKSVYLIQPLLSN